MKFGLAFASSVGIEQEQAFDICRIAEAAGFESLWGGEHVIVPSAIESSCPHTADGKIPAEPETPIPDPLIWLPFAATAAPTMALATCILIVPNATRSCSPRNWPHSTGSRAGASSWAWESAG